MSPARSSPPTVAERDRHDRFRAFLDWLHANNQHWIPILDAGIPKVDDVDDYPLYAVGRDLDVFIKQENGKEFVGQVWPG